MTINLYTDVKVQLIDHMGGDESIVQAARVSVQGANELFDHQKDAGLINYLMREKHGSPFEHNSLKFYVKAPIFVFREFHRHRMASYNEMSGRYTELKPDFYIPARDRKLVNVGTSARPEFAIGTAKQIFETEFDISDVYELAWMKYQKMLSNGIANEVARMVLPVGIFSEMYVTMNLRSIFNFLSLRTQVEGVAHVSRPQREIEMVAEKIEKIVKQLFPIAYEAYNKNRRVAP
jgi:thymidylate synthase (FAD)